MPKIQEYSPQTSAAGPERQTAANVEDTGNVGTMIRNAGNEVEGAAVLLDRRMGQADVADQAAAISGAHAQLGNELTDKVQNATPNEINGKNEDGSDGQRMTDKFSDRVDDVFSGLPQPSTRAGREFAERQKAAIKQHLVMSMGRSQAILAGANAVHTAQTTVSTAANSLEQDPASFDLQIQSHSDYVDAMVKTGGLPAAKAPEMIQWGNEQLAEGAARGYIKADPEAGQKMLNAGVWDQYLTRPQKDELSNYADRVGRANDLDAARQDKQAKDAQKQVVDSAKAEMITKLYTNGHLTARQVVTDPRLKNDPQAMENMLNILDKHTKDALRTDPALYNDLMDRIHAPLTTADGKPNPQAITDVSQLDQRLGSGGLSIPDRNKLAAELKKTPDWQQDSVLTKQAISTARSALTKTNPMLNLKDPQGDEQMSLFLKDFMDTKQKARAAGKTSNDLYNPKSPDYIGNLYQKYQQTPQQIMQNQADAMTKAFAQKAPAAPAASAPSGTIRVRKNGQTGNYKGSAADAVKLGYEVVK